MAAALDLHLAVRGVHLLGMAVLLGGAAFTWNACRRDPAASLRQAVDYEWVFWGTAGVMLVTGVGNLAAVGAPGPATRWGTVFLPKLLLVVFLVVGSFLRTLVVLRVRATGVGTAGVAADRLRWSYGATALVLLAIVVAAEVLVYG